MREAEFVGHLSLSRRSLVTDRCKHSNFTYVDFNSLTSPKDYMQIKVLSVSRGAIPLSDGEQQCIGELNWQNGQAIYQMYAAEVEVSKLSLQERSVVADGARAKLSEVLNDAQATMQQRLPAYSFSVGTPSCYTLKLQKLLNPVSRLKLTAYREEDGAVSEREFEDFNEFARAFTSVMDNNEFLWLETQLNTAQYAVDVFENRRLVAEPFIQTLRLKSRTW